MNYKFLSMMTIALLSLGLVENSYAQLIQPGHETVQVTVSQFHFTGTSPLPLKISGEVLPVNFTKTIFIVILDSQQNIVGTESRTSCPRWHIRLGNYGRRKSSVA